MQFAGLESDAPLLALTIASLQSMTTNAEHRRTSRRRAQVPSDSESAPQPTGHEEPAAEASTDSDASVPPNLAHPIRRLYAFTIDIGLWLGIVYIVAPISGGRLFSDFSYTTALIDILLFFGYFVLLTGIFGRTLGKWVAGIRVVDAEGNAPGVALAIPREMAGRFVAVIAAGIGLIWIAFDTDRQGWHDKIAGTYVVNDSAAGPSFLSRFFFPEESPDSAAKKKRAAKSRVGSRTSGGRRRKRRSRGLR